MSFLRPEAMAVLIPGRPQGEFILFCRDKNLEREIWDGYREGPDGARENYAADDAFPIDDMDEILPGLIEGREKIFFSVVKHAELDKHLTQWLKHIRANARSGASAPGEIVDPDHIRNHLRKRGLVPLPVAVRSGHDHKSARRVHPNRCAFI